MKTHPVQMTRIDELPVSVFEDGSVEIVDETSGVPVTLSRRQIEKIEAISRHDGLESTQPHGNGLTPAWR
jgi:hypothetical protein